MRKVPSSVPAAVFCAMALSTVLVGCMNGSGAAPSTTAKVAASERRTLGCGTGAVELRWSSTDPVQLVVYDSNIRTAHGHDAGPLQTGDHAYVSPTSTLSWRFTTGDGATAEPQLSARCVRFS